MSNSTTPELTPTPMLTQEPQPVAKPGEMFPGEDAQLSAYFKQQKVAEQELWAASMRVAVKSDPALYAEADKLALENGLTVDTAMRNMEFLRGASRIKRMQDDKIESTNPSWFRSMQSVEFARKAWDDDQLPLVEKWAKAFKSGGLQAERGKIATKVMFTPGKLTQADRDTLDRVTKDLQDYGQIKGFSPISYAFELLGQQWESLPKAAAIGLTAGGAAAGVNAAMGPAAITTPLAFATGFKAGFFTTLATDYFQVEAGNAYADMVLAGYDEDRAWKSAFFVGTANAALGLGGFKLATGATREAIMRSITKKAVSEAAKETAPGFAKAFAKEYLKANVGEAGTEVLEEMNTIIGELAAAQGGEDEMNPDGIASRLWEVASKTIQGMAVLGVPNAYVAGKRARLVKLAEAIEAAANLQEPMAAGSESPLTKRDSKSAEQAVENMLQHHGAARTVYVDAATLKDALAQADKAIGDAATSGEMVNPPGQVLESSLDKLERIVPGITEQIQDASSRGSDVQIPTAKLLTAIASEIPEVGKVLQGKIRFEQGADSADEAAEDQKEAEQQAKQAEADNEIFKAMEDAMAGERNAIARGEAGRAALTKAGVKNEADVARFVNRKAAKDRREEIEQIKTLLMEGSQENGKDFPGLRKALDDAKAEKIKPAEVEASVRIITSVIETLADAGNISPMEVLQQFRTVFASGVKDGQETLSQFVGVQAKGVNKTTMRKAFGMLQQGASADAIYAETGWRVSPQGSLRIELSDDSATLKTTQGGLLGDVLNHPALFKAYPKLKEIPVKFGKVGEGVAGVYYGSKTLLQWTPSTASIFIADELSESMKLRTILHEVQHAIQDIEGDFSSGTKAQIASASEVEARNVESRRKMTAEERASVSPDSTEDVPRSKVLTQSQESNMSDADVAAAEKEARAARTSITEARNQASDILRQPSRGNFDPSILAIIFGKESDVSTILHELTHWYVEVLLRMARVGNVPAGIQKQVDALMQRWGVANVQEFDALAKDAKEAHLEDIAYNAEDYFSTGEAPSKELQTLFGQIRKWMIRVYETVRDVLNRTYKQATGKDLPGMTPELRGFFDRMIASDNAIEIVQSEREGAMAFDPSSAEKFGLSKDTVADLERLREEAKQEAKDHLGAEAVRASRIYQAARRGAEKDAKAKLKASRERIRGEVEKDISARPVYAAQTFIKNGEVVNDRGETVSAKLDTDMVRAILGDDAKALKGYTKKGGTNPSLMARQFKFTSGEEMLRAMLTAQPMAAAIEAETEARLEAEEPLSDPKEMRRAVEASLRGKAATRLASTLLREMLGSPPGVTQAQLEASASAAARQILLRTKVGEISVRGYSQAEFRAGKEVRRAMAKGDKDAAIDAQRKYLLQHFLTRQAIEIEKELDRFADVVSGSYLKADDDVIKAKRNLDKVYGIRSMLGRLGYIGTARAQAADAYMATMAIQNQSGHTELAARINAAVPAPTPWRSVPLESMRVIIDVADSLWRESKRGEQFRLGDKLVDRQEVQGKLETSVVNVYGDTSKKKPEEPGDWDLATIFASLWRLEAFCIMLDGGNVGGDWWRHVYKPLKDGQTAKDVEAVEERRWYKEWLDQHDGDLSTLPGGEFDAQEWLGEGASSVFKTKADLLGILLQMGTDSNRRNIATGNSWATQKEGELYANDGTPFWPKFQLMLKELVRLGILNKKDFDLNQKALDHIRDNIKTRLFDVTREAWSYYPEEVKASAFDTPFGSYPGGYYPSKVDKSKSTIDTRNGLDSVASMRDEFVGNTKSVSRGMTINRKQGAREPRVIDVRLLWEHIDDALKIIHLAIPLQDVASLFRGGSLQTKLNSASPAAMKAIILPALDRVARQSTTSANADPSLRRFVENVRQITSTMFLGLNPRNAAQQFTGLANAALYSSVPQVWGSFWKFWRNPAKMIEAIKAKSEAMGIRWSDEMQALSNDIRQILDPNLRQTIQQQAAKIAFVMQRYAQMATDAIAWDAAFEKHTVAGVGEAEALDRADSAVRMSQGEKTPLDVPRMLSGHPMTQLFTQFADYPNVVLNANLSAPEGRKFAAVMLTLIAPTLAASLIALGFAGGQLGKGSRSDDDELEDIIAKLLGDQVKGAFSMIPGLGSLAGSAVVSAVDSVAGVVFGDVPKLGGETQLRSSPFAADALLQMIQRITAGSATQRDVAAFMTMATKLPLMPFGNAFSYLDKRSEGKAGPSPWFGWAGPLDTARGMVVGR